MAVEATSLTPQATVPSVPKELERPPLVTNNRSIGWLSDRISSIAEGPTPKWWCVSFVISVSMMAMCFGVIGYQISTGVGVWGNSHPVMWGWPIV